MKYITSRELSEKWNISQRRIVRLAIDGRITGAKLYGKSWMFPENAEKPIDGRTKEGKTEKQNSDNFRYPIFEFKDASSFNPPLTKEELTIKAVIEAVNGCRFDEADKKLGALPKKAKNKYIRIAALYCKCMTTIFFCDTVKFLDCYGKLTTELKEDFPHRAEMNEYLYEIDAALGKDEYYSHEFNNKPAYNYHESFLPRLCNLSAFGLALGNKEIKAADLALCEIICYFLESTDNYFDLQALHIYLACAYSIIDKTEECKYHFRKALNLAEKYDMFYSFAAMRYYYVPQDLEDVLQEYSEELKNKIKECNTVVNQCFIKFTEALQVNSIYNLLTDDDYVYIVFAIQKLSNKEIAKKMNITSNAVGKRYSKIYAQLGVRTKNDMIRVYRKMVEKTAEDK